MKTPNTTPWRDIAKRNQAQWRAAYAQLERDLKHVPWAGRIATHLRWRSNLPTTMLCEIEEVATLTKTKPATVLAAQVVYDELWNSHRGAPLRGCTSISTPNSFGRNLDYGYPANIGDMIYHSDYTLNGHATRIEGVAGLMGWAAISSDVLSASMNQAPALRALNRSHLPATAWFAKMCAWAMSVVDIPDEGNDSWNGAPAADVLVHARLGSRRFLLETFSNRVAWKRGTGKMVQTNSYQLLDHLRAGQEWEQDSEQRAKAAGNATSVVEGLKATTVPGWTVDTFMM